MRLPLADCQRDEVFGCCVRLQKIEGGCRPITDHLLDCRMSPAIRSGGDRRFRHGCADSSGGSDHWYCLGMSRRGPYSGGSSQRKLPELISPRSTCSMSPSGISRAALIVVAPEPSPSSSALSQSSSSTAFQQAVAMSG